MCRQAPEDLLDLIEKTEDPAELRRLLKEICNCRECHAERCNAREEVCGRSFLHRVEFKNWLMLLVNDPDS
jgi:hypothetical protein